MKMPSVLAREALAYATEFFTSRPCPTKRKQSLIYPHWVAPKQGDYKLNTDGSSVGNPGLASGGGVIRDCNGRWVGGFTRRIGWGTSILAEIWALRDGLTLAVEKSLSPLVVEMDATLAIHLVKGNSPDTHIYAGIINDCRSLLRRLQVQDIRHIYREGNGCADKLARMGLSLAPNEHFVSFDTPPEEICNILAFDCMGTSTPRLIYDPA